MQMSVSLSVSLFVCQRFTEIYRDLQFISVEGTTRIYIQMPINYWIRITLMQYQRKHKYKNYNSLITNACVGSAVVCQPERIE